MEKFFIKISTPCNENWDNMKPNENGNFCNLCSKTVIDFSKLNQNEIAEKMKKADNNICARVTQNQLSTPIFLFETQKKHHLPFSNIAAGLMIATTLAATPQLQANNNHKVEMETLQTTISSLKSKNNKNETPPNKTESDKAIVFRGKITSEDKNEPVENAKVIFVTLKKVFTAYTLKDGTFSINIPTELIDNDNVVRVNYKEIKTKTTTEGFLDFESTDIILTKQDINSNYQIKALPTRFMLGGAAISRVEKHKPDAIIYNGVEIIDYDFRSIYNKYIKNRKENINIFSFKSETAKALYKKVDIDCLYIIIDTPE